MWGVGPGVTQILSLGFILFDSEMNLKTVIWINIVFSDSFGLFLNPDYAILVFTALTLALGSIHSAALRLELTAELFYRKFFLTLVVFLCGEETGKCLQVGRLVSHLRSDVLAVALFRELSLLCKQEVG